MTISVSVSKWISLESKEMEYWGTRLLTLNFSSTLSLTTSGRTFRLCGAMGVTTKFLLSGESIGPPQLSEYAVEPVGVETMSPSPQKY